MRLLSTAFFALSGCAHAPPTDEGPPVAIAMRFDAGGPVLELEPTEPLRDLVVRIRSGSGVVLSGSPTVRATLAAGELLELAIPSGWQTVEVEVSATGPEGRQRHVAVFPMFGSRPRGNTGR